MDQRLSNINIWLKKALNGAEFELTPIVGDASFRRYFRIRYGDKRAILMDATEREQQSCQAFVNIARSFSELGLCVPEIIHEDIPQGFILLSDLGDELYLRQLNENNADQLYKVAIEALLTLQQCKQLKYYRPPHFDNQLMQKELNLFEEWFLSKHLQITLNADMQESISKIMTKLINELQQQPYVCVHRDYHSRNLLVVDSHRVGILDFQDAVLGPISYDLVSLFKDCYISWPREKVVQWVNYYFELAMQKNVLPVMEFNTFLQWFDWMGIQRHLKVLGIFSRLNYLYGKPTYMNDIPRILNYVIKILPEYSAWAELNDFFHQVILVKLNNELVLL